MSDPQPAWQPDPAIARLLDGLAGFHDRELDALQAVQRLGVQQGLQSSQIVLLGPADAFRPRFAWKARQWNRRPHGAMHDSLSSTWTMAWAAAASCVVAALTLPQLDLSFGPELAALSLLAAALCGAGVAAIVPGVLRSQQPQFIAFDRTIRQHLARGSWVVLVHDLRWAQQAAAIDGLGRSVGQWCAVSSGRCQF